MARKNLLTGLIGEKSPAGDFAAESARPCPVGIGQRARHSVAYDGFSGLHSDERFLAVFAALSRKKPKPAARRPAYITAADRRRIAKAHLGPRDLSVSVDLRAAPRFRRFFPNQSTGDFRAVSLPQNSGGRVRLVA